MANNFSHHQAILQKHERQIDKTNEENSHFTVLFKLALIIFTSWNNKLLKHCSVSVGKTCE